MWQIIIIACLVNAQLEVPDQIIKRLKTELDYESMLVVHNHFASCVIDLQRDDTMPIINFNEKQNFSIKTTFNRRFLVLVCLSTHSITALNVLSKNLDGMRDTAIVLVLAPEVKLSLSNAFKNCLWNKMLNVIAIRNWKQDHHVYSYRAFPQFKVIKRHISQVERFFVPQMRNMGGHPIISVPDNILPRSVYYRDAMEKPHVVGYLASFLYNFAKTLNATVRICWDHVPLNMPEEMISQGVIELTDEGMVDIPLCIINTASTVGQTSLISSYVMETSTWQLIVPLEAECESEFLIFTAASKAQMCISILIMVLFALLLHNFGRLELGESANLRCLYQLIDPVLRAVTNQTFVLPRQPSRMLRGVYSMLFLFSFLSYNIYIAQLEMILVHPPREKPLKSYQDLRHVGLKILLTPDDKHLMHDLLGSRHMNEFWDIYEVVNRSTFQSLRRQPNISYAYPITHTLWPLIQRKFAKQPYPLFRLSKEFTFVSFLLFGLPLSRNSIYEEPLNRYILNTHCSGLYNHWFHRCFDKLVEIGKMEVLPYISIEETFHILRWEHFRYIWVFYFIHISFATIVFVFEIGLANLMNRYIYYIPIIW
ncbi:uncharacterized protein LOC133840758 [Drosophila sulfurigaster albostrigata]|uniref:uncharacterized protein LOC133840758 n=1 Tax=Drosophila sulfurigaster albostrigata TaxID=89887 RepID=UPI002D21D1B9|nr:uncharacterized protein LOC133840758 [Drosophila sulfurigaster albostrigata]